MTTCAAFLRGINLGGNKRIKMADVKKAFESLGFTNVKTILASGNVVFDSAKSVSPTEITDKLQKAGVHKVGVILRTDKEVKKIVDSGTFKDIKVTPNMRLYVTFLSGKANARLNPSPLKEFRIMRITSKEVFSVLTVTPKTRTPEYVTFLEKEFGENITTRNWNTVIKVSEAIEKKE